MGIECAFEKCEGAPPRVGEVVEQCHALIARPLDHFLRLFPAQLFHRRVVVLLTLRQEHFQNTTLVL